MSYADIVFWPKVVMAGADDCWMWTACRNRKGYGQFRFQRRAYLAHRFSYQLVNGEVPRSTCVLHRCDNPSCVNPRHLFLGTRADNNADMMAKGRYARGETNGQSRLTRAMVADISGAVGSHRQIASRFGVHQTTVTRVKAGVIWREA